MNQAQGPSLSLSLALSLCLSFLYVHTCDDDEGRCGAAVAG